MQLPRLEHELQGYMNNFSQLKMNYISIPKSNIFGNCFGLGTAWMPVQYGSVGSMFLDSLLGLVLEKD